MIRGLYIASTGMISQKKSIDVMSNNVANSQTAGFKEDALVTTTFGDQLSYRLDAGTNPVQIGNTNLGRDAAQIFTSFDQGAIKQTDRELDFAIEGDGFFTLQEPDGTIGLTRNGQFSVDASGYLVGSKGSMVLGRNGPIMVGQANFNVDEIGQVYVNGNYIDTLQLICPADLTTLVKQEEGVFIDTNPLNQSQQFNGRIVQRSLETSNVNMTKTMSDIIASSRAFQACSQIVKMMDQILQKSVNEVGRL